MNIFFDLDGTLVDASERLYRLYYNYAIRKGFVPMLKGRYIAIKKSGVSEKSLVHDQFSNVTDEYLEWRKAQGELPDYLKFDTVFAGVDNLLSRLASTCTLFILTSRMNHENTVTELETHGIAQYFKEILTTPGEDAISKKSNGLQLACKTHGLSENKSIIVGDSEVEVGVGVKLGIPCICVTYGIRSDEFFKNVHHGTRVNTVSELEDAIYLVQNSVITS